MTSIYTVHQHIIWFLPTSTPPAAVRARFL